MTTTCSRRLRHAIGVGIAASVLFTPQPVGRGVTAAQATVPVPRAGSSDARMQWWREARFGMFIHWGLYAVPAGEWQGRTDYGEWIRNNARIPLDDYDQFRGRFNPTAFDPNMWARLARRAGMRYIVITTKHHDGFCLFDSKQTGFTVMATPFCRDIMKELLDACRREGIRVGWYHSIMDWHHPDYLPRRNWEQDRSATGADFDRYVRYLETQVRELLTNYGPVDVMWFDGQWESTWTNERGRRLYDYVRSLQPGIIVNNRVGGGGGDFGTPEQEIPATGVPGVDWETCMTMNGNWGFNRADKAFKPARELIRNLVDIASKGGNFLLNVGPDADGRLPAESIERLESIGKWMDTNGESIHGTQASPLPSVPWGRCTQKRLEGDLTRLYLHVFDWPTDGVLVVDRLLNVPVRAYLLSAGPTQPLPVSAKETGTGRIEIRVPVTPGNEADSVIALDVRGRPDVALPPAISADAPIFVDALDVSVASSQERVAVRYTTDGTTPTRNSPVVSGPVRLTRSATVTALAFRGDRRVSPVATASFTKVAPLPPVAGVAEAEGLEYDCVEGDFKQLPDFDRAVPAKRGTAGGFDLSARTREAQFALRFRGYIRVPADGVYRFFVRSDDGSRLWIGQTLVVDNDGLHSVREGSAVVALGAGLQPITVAMFEQSGGFDLEVAWSGPGLSKQIVPSSALCRRR